MLLLRPVKESDLNALFELSLIGRVGLTTLPQDRKILQRCIDLSIKSFQGGPAKPDWQDYLFVMEDIDDHRLIGTAGIIAQVGAKEPFYTYEIKTVKKDSKSLNVHKNIQYLQLVKKYKGPTEIGTLFLRSDYRHKGVGRFLSSSRFLFMAQYPSYFKKDVIAEVRGVFDENDRSPFWEALGKHFIALDFKKADLMVMEDKRFIEELFPKHPIYIPLLTREAQAVIGKAHENSQPAKYILEGEGFQFKGEIDIFEAGPVIDCKLKKIKTIQQSREVKISEIIDGPIKSPVFIIAKVNSFEYFSMTMGHLSFIDAKTVSIRRKTAATLKLSRGDKIRISLLKQEKTDAK